MTMTLDTALRAIRAKCMDCCGRSKKLVEICQADTCPLHPYRKYEGGAIERDPAFFGISTFTTLFMLSSLPTHIF